LTSAGVAAFLRQLRMRSCCLIETASARLGPGMTPDARRRSSGCQDPMSADDGADASITGCWAVPRRDAAPAAGARSGSEARRSWSAS